MESGLHIPDLSCLRLYVYRRPLHPELFRMFLDQKIRMARYDADLWVLGLGHLACFHTADSTITELVVAESRLFSENGLIERLALESKHDYQFCLDQDIHYMVATESERMSDAVFEREYASMVKFGKKRGLFMQFQHWPACEGMTPFTLIDYEHRPNELCVAAYHAFPAQKRMLKTQSVFSREPVAGTIGPPNRNDAGKRQ